MVKLQEIIEFAERVQYCPYCEIETHEAHYCKVCGERFVKALTIPDGFIKHMKEIISPATMRKKAKAEEEREALLKKVYEL